MKVEDPNTFDAKDAIGHQRSGTNPQAPQQPPAQPRQDAQQPQARAAQPAAPATPPARAADTAPMNRSESRADQNRANGGELFTYKRKNATGGYETRQARASEHDALERDGWMRLDEITGNAEDATAKPPSNAPTAPRPK